MEIKNVDLVLTAENTPHNFVISWEGVDHQTSVPITEPSSHFYHQIKEWYDAQDTKPFDFEFEEIPEPVFAETVYPEEAEAPEETETTTPDEPKTLLPK